MTTQDHPDSLVMLDGMEWCAEHGGFDTTESGRCDMPDDDDGPCDLRPLYYGPRPENTASLTTSENP